VIRSIAKVPLYEVDRAAVPYILLMFLGMAIIVAFPQIALWLPGTMNLGR
jgi:C4-dicarboxylate transporter DctM subunit